MKNCFQRASTLNAVVCVRVCLELHCTAEEVILYTWCYHTQTFSFIIKNFLSSDRREPDYSEKVQYMTLIVKKARLCHGNKQPKVLVALHTRGVLCHHIHEQSQQKGSADGGGEETQLRSPSRQAAPSTMPGRTKGTWELGEHTGSWSLPGGRHHPPHQ